MRTSDEDRLLPYIENKLEASESPEMHSRLASDPALADEARRLRRTVDSLRQAAARAPAGQAADHWPAVRARLVLAPTPRRASAALWAASGAALAALAAAFAVFWLPQHGTHRAEWIAPRPSQAQTAPTPAVAPVPVAAVAPAPTAVSTQTAADAHTAADTQAAVSPQKLASLPQLLLHTHYDPLASAKRLPYLQADPFAPMPPKPTPRYRPPSLRARRLKPGNWRRPVAPLLSAGKLPAARAKATRPVLLPSQNSTPPLAAPDTGTPAASAAAADSVPRLPPAPAQKTAEPLRHPASP